MNFYTIVYPNSCYYFLHNPVILYAIKNLKIKLHKTTISHIAFSKCETLSLNVRKYHELGDWKQNTRENVQV
jgi:hypothetical protein